MCQPLSRTQIRGRAELTRACSLVADPPAGTDSGHAAVCAVVVGGRKGSGMGRAMEAGGALFTWGAQGRSLDEVMSPEAEGSEGPWERPCQAAGRGPEAAPLVREPPGRPCRPGSAPGVRQVTSGATGGFEQGDVVGLPAGRPCCPGSQTVSGWRAAGQVTLSEP